MGVPMNMRWTVIWASVGLGLEGGGSAFLGPGADLVVITTAWVAMIVTLAAQADVDIERNTIVKIVGALLISLGGFIGGTKLAIQGFALTGIGTIPAIVANVGINAVVTYTVGMAVARLFIQKSRVDSIELFVQAVVGAVLAALGLSALQN